MSDLPPADSSASTEPADIVRDQELAAAPAASPIPRDQRIPVLDVVRGVALLGILIDEHCGFRRRK